MEENKHLHGPEYPAENSCGHEGCGCGHEHSQEHGHSHEHSHEHSHDGQCSCGHEHNHEHGHSHEHSHEHSHDGQCSCGCGHEHSHEHGHSHEHSHEHSHDGQCSCGCGHEHSHEHGHSHEHSHSHGHHNAPGSPCTVYVMKNIDCANCSAKIEAKIKELPEVDDAVLTFATRQLRVYSSAGTALLPKMQEIADKIEPGTVIEVRSRNPKAPYVVYNLENIDCANCSAKIEAKIKELPEVDDAVLTFATRQLRVYSSAGTALLPKMQEIADKIGAWYPDHGPGGGKAPERRS